MSRFNVLVVDPPWSYRNKRTGGSMSSGSAQQYNTMTLDELVGLHDLIHNVIDDNSVCFMWTTNPMLTDALMLLDAWDFRYKTMITWVKKNYGMGYWFRGRTEHILLGIRGKVKPFKANIGNVIIAEETLRHSQKPIDSYMMINDATKNMIPSSVLELFARDKQYLINWTCIGKEVTGNDIITDLKNLSKIVNDEL